MCTTCHQVSLHNIRYCVVLKLPITTPGNTMHAEGTPRQRRKLSKRYPVSCLKEVRLFGQRRGT